jgi:D-alanyl-D-alanine carboxypeptidase
MFKLYTVYAFLIALLLINISGCNRSLNKLNKNDISNVTKISAVTLTPYPTSIAVVVNKKYYMPVNYVPKDLVYPNVPFLFKEKIEKREMRKEAALALEKLFAAAKNDGIYLSGVSAYRSYATQEALFNNYVKRDGFANARTYSAIPGTSEHQTGLAIDVSGINGICAAESCFANSKEAAWLKKNAANYGFIVRYPLGKENITGYKYEPWHIRYVGSSDSKAIQSRGVTLEEYLHVVPVSDVSKYKKDFH